MGPSWEASRMVSYHQSLARMSLTPPKDAAPGGKFGSVFLQSFLLSDGSPCLKATVGWEGSAASSVVAVYAKPELDWKSEADAHRVRLARRPAADSMGPRTSSCTMS
jgi:hypothetical protein